MNTFPKPNFWGKPAPRISTERAHYSKPAVLGAPYVFDEKPSPDATGDSTEPWVPLEYDGQYLGEVHPQTARDVMVPEAPIPTPLWKYVDQVADRGRVPDLCQEDTAWTNAGKADFNPDPAAKINWDAEIHLPNLDKKNSGLEYRYAKFSDESDRDFVTRVAGYASSVRAIDPAVYVIFTHPELVQTATNLVLDGINAGINAQNYVLDTPALQALQMGLNIITGKPYNLEQGKPSIADLGSKPLEKAADTWTASAPYPEAIPPMPYDPYRELNLVDKFFQVFDYIEEHTHDFFWTCYDFGVEVIFSAKQWFGKLVRQPEIDRLLNYNGELLLKVGELTEKAATDAQLIQILEDGKARYYAQIEDMNTIAAMTAERHEYAVVGYSRMIEKLQWLLKSAPMILADSPALLRRVQTPFAYINPETFYELRGGILNANPKISYEEGEATVPGSPTKFIVTNLMPTGQILLAHAEWPKQPTRFVNPNLGGNPNEGVCQQSGVCERSEVPSTRNS